MQFDITHYIDIHSHILPGIDDGCGSMGESLEMARRYAATGVTQVIATPHFLPGTKWATPKAKVLELVDQVQQQLDRQKIALRILPGMEIANHGRLLDRLKEGELLSLGASNHYLIEPSFHGPQDELLECLSEALDNGFKLILAHPERVNGLQNKIDMIGELVQRGLRLQINGGSLLGKVSSELNRAARRFWDEQCCHFIASDAHGLDRRCPFTNQQWQQLLAGTVTSRMLAETNRNLATMFSDMDHEMMQNSH